MEKSHVSEAAILSFERNYSILRNGESTDILEESIDPIEALPDFDQLCKIDQKFDPKLLSQTVVIKLNGGLGTSMGLQKAKSLLEVKEGSTFLDIIVNQIAYLRENTGANVRFLLMNSFNTSSDTMEHLAQYSELGFDKKSEVELYQNQIPKIDAQTLSPVEFPENPSNEWCPPGHGDIYSAIIGSGWLDKLLSEGVKYAFVSNSDNLGAVLDPSLLDYFASSTMPFLMEVTRRTEADKKGGHLAVRKSDKQLLLREIAQTADADLISFQDIEKHKYFNTNNLWVNLESLRKELKSQGGSLGLPAIVNKKTVDPRNKSSSSVYQLETAMGAAIECFRGAAAINVPRSRFAPVKTTSDLFLLRSDAYKINEQGGVSLSAECKGEPPIVILSDEYKLVDSLEGLGLPSLKGAHKLVLNGPLRFADHVEIKGTVNINNSKTETSWIANGVYDDENVEID